MQRIAVMIVFGFLCAAAQAQDGYRLLQMDDHDVKWGNPKLGAGATVSYAIATDRTHESGIINCQETTGIAALLAKSGVSLNAFDSELTAAFAMWEQAANVRFVPAKNSAAADVVITAEAVSDGMAYTDVTPASSTTKPVSRIRKGIICLNPDLSWRAAIQTGERAKTYRLQYVLAHEIGHVLGLDHPSPEGELMSFEYNGAMTALQPGDIAGIDALYGVSHHRVSAPVMALNAKSPRALP